MSTIARVDDSRLSRRMEALRRRAEPAGLEVAKSGADHFVAFMEEKAPRDTRRYVRGWIEAGNQAGLTRRAMPALQTSQWQDRYLDALSRQIERHIARITSLQGMLDKWYYSKGRRLNAWARSKEAEVNKRTAALVRAVEQLRRFQKATGPVLFFAGAEATQLIGSNLWRDIRRKASTVRDKIYGGAGAVVVEDGEARVVLRNLEPHGRLVERRTRIVGRARAAVKQFTDAESKRVFRSEIGKV